MTELETTHRRISDRLGEICGHLNVLHAEMVALTAEAIETAVWAGAGIQTPQHWLGWQTGLSPERARQIVRIAERSSELPVTLDAFAQGRLSLDQVAVVAARTPAGYDDQACGLALFATVSQLRVGLSKHFFPPQPDPEPAHRPAPEPARRLSVGFNDNGDFYLHGVTDAVQGAVIHNALREAKDALFRAGDTDATWLDALAEIATRSLAAVGSLSRREAYKIIVHLDTNGAWLHQGPVLPPALFEQVCCDGVIQPLWVTEGAPINMGRARHIVALRTRIVVQDRDRVCRHPTCPGVYGLQVHHIIHWLGDGVSDTPNLCCLCPKHHRAHHRGQFSIEGNADHPNGLTFRDRHGHIIQPNGQPTPPAGQPPPHPAHPYQHPTGERLHTKWLDYHPPQPPRAPPNQN